jgi:hypothetical protein
MISIEWDSQTEAEEIPSSQQEDEEFNRKQIEDIKSKIAKGYTPFIHTNIVANINFSEQQATQLDLDDVSNISNEIEVQFVLIPLLNMNRRRIHNQQYQAITIRR